MSSCSISASGQTCYLRTRATFGAVFNYLAFLPKDLLQPLTCRFACCFFSQSHERNIRHLRPLQALCPQLWVLWDPKLGAGYMCNVCHRLILLFQLSFLDLCGWQAFVPLDRHICQHSSHLLNSVCCTFSYFWLHWSVKYACVTTTFSMSIYFAWVTREEDAVYCLLGGWPKGVHKHVWYKNIIFCCVKLS